MCYAANGTGQPCPTCPPKPEHTVCDGVAEIDASMTFNDVITGVTANSTTKATVILAAIAFSLSHWQHFLQCCLDEDGAAFSDEEAALIRSIFVFYMNSKLARQISDSEE